MKNRPLSTYTFLALAICAFIGWWLYALFTPVVTEPGGLVYFVRPGISKRLVIEDLAQKNLIKYPRLFALYAYPQQSAVLKEGEYLLPAGATSASIWQQITTGKGIFYHTFIIVPGWTFKQIRAELQNATALRHFTSAMNDNQIMTRLGSPNISPEGEFYPETYNYIKGTADLVILKRALVLMQNKLQDAWEHRSSNVPYKNAYEALIAASLIEKEAYLDTERPIISGVIVNRLQKDMLLQIDASVIYGLGDHYSGKIYKSDLLGDTLYNTYIHKGLPPTPIAIPGATSINAAVNPQQNDYLYYVAKGDGSHQFSKSLQEHNAAVQSVSKYQHSQFNTPLIMQHIKVSLGNQLYHVSINQVQEPMNGTR